MLDEGRAGFNPSSFKLKFKLYSNKSKTIKAQTRSNLKIKHFRTQAQALGCLTHLTHQPKILIQK